MGHCTSSSCNIRDAAEEAKLESDEAIPVNPNDICAAVNSKQGSDDAPASERQGVEIDTGPAHNNADATEEAMGETTAKSEDQPHNTTEACLSDEMPATNFLDGVMDVAGGEDKEETLISQKVEDKEDGKRQAVQEVCDAKKIQAQMDDTAQVERDKNKNTQPDSKQHIGPVAKKKAGKNAKQKLEQDAKTEAKKAEDQEAQRRAAEEKQKLILLSKCEEGDAKSVKKMLKDGVGWDASNADGWNALHLSARAGSEELVKCLLKKGMKVTDKAPNGNNALHFAAQSNSVWCCALLAHASPSVMSEKNSSGKLPIDMVHPGVTGKELTKELSKWQLTGNVPQIKTVGNRKILA